MPRRALVKPAVEVTWAEWDDVVDTNLKGAYFMSRTYAAHCIARKRPGCIVNIASTHGLTGFAGRTVYGICKGGLIQMTRMLAIEWIGHNIRVNSVAPSTALTASRATMYDDDDARAHARAHSDRPLHHAGRSRRGRRFPRQPRRRVDHRPDARGRRRVYGELTSQNHLATGGFRSVKSGLYGPDDARCIGDYVRAASRGARRATAAQLAAVLANNPLSAHSQETPA